MCYLGVDCSEEVSSLFRGELNPVASKAQKKVQVPEGYGCLTLYSIILFHLSLSLRHLLVWISNVSSTE